MTWYCARCGTSQLSGPLPCPVCGGRAFASSLILDDNTVETILLPLTPEEANA